MSYRKTFNIMVVLLFLGALSGCDKLPFGKKEAATTRKPILPAELSKDTLLAVGSWTLTAEEFKQRLKNLKNIAPDFNIDDPNSRRLVLEELLRQQLLVADAEQTGMANKKEVLNAVNEFRRTLLVREVAAQITEGIEATTLEAQDYYNQNKDAFVEPVQWRVREIVMNSQKRAQNLLADLLKGDDFAAAARNYSESDSASRGGDLGFISVAPFPQMQNALASLEEDGISSVFKGPDGFYIIKVEEKRGGEQRAFSELQDDIKAGLTLMKQQQAILTHLNGLREKINVQVNQDLVEKIIQEQI